MNFKNVSPKLSVDYQFTPDLMAYVSASRGFKSGGYNIRANTTAVPRSGQPFDDEQVDSYEIGSKMGLLDGRAFLNLAYFYNKYKDIQLSVFTQYQLPNGSYSFFGDFTNAGKGTVQGVEVEYQFLPTRHWLISGNLAWLDAKYDEFMSGGVNIAKTQYFTNAPKYSGALNVEWRTDLAGGGNLSARATYSYQSEVWPTTDLSKEIRQDGYGLLSAGVIWKLDDAWSLSLQGTNLTDKAYRTTGYNIAAYGVLTGFYGAPARCRPACATTSDRCVVRVDDGPGASRPRPSGAGRWRYARPMGRQDTSRARAAGRWCGQGASAERCPCAWVRRPC